MQSRLWKIKITWPRLSVVGSFDCVQSMINIFSPGYATSIPWLQSHEILVWRNWFTEPKNLLATVNTLFVSAASITIIDGLMMMTAKLGCNFKCSNLPTKNCESWLIGLSVVTAISAVNNGL